jgi:hypothetical protein
MARDPVADAYPVRRPARPQAVTGGVRLSRQLNPRAAAVLLDPRSIRPPCLQMAKVNEHTTIHLVTSRLRAWALQINHHVSGTTAQVNDDGRIRKDSGLAPFSLRLTPLNSAPQPTRQRLRQSGSKCAPAGLY